jgi:hypothetical protein
MSAQPKIPPQLPANDPPALRAFEAVAEEFGFKTTRALRDWCKSRGVPYTRDGKYNWVDRNLVVAAIARGRVVRALPPADASVTSWVRDSLGGPRGT